MSSSDNTEVQPFPETKWHGFKARMTKASRDFTKRIKRDRSGYRVDSRAVCLVSVMLYMRGNGELVGWESPEIKGLEPRSNDWLKLLELETPETPEKE